MALEALGIISFSLGIITFTHNGINTIRGERDDWQKARGYLVDVERKLCNIERRVVAWRKQWIVPAFSVTKDEENRVDYSSIFQYLWGNDWRKISECLGRINEEIKKFKPFLTKLTTQSKHAARLNMVFGGKEKLKKWLTAITDNLEELETESCNLFRDACAGDDDDIRDELTTIGDAYIKRRITEHVFVSLAKITSEFSRYLYTSCEVEHEVLTTRLLIDLFRVEASQEPLDPKRQEIIIRTLASERNRSLEFPFLMKSTHPTLFLGTKVRGSDVEVENCKNTMSLAFNHVLEGTGDIYSGFHTQGVWFSVKKDRITSLGSVPDNSKSVDHRSNSLLGQLRALDVARARLAYFLAEFGLLLLKTPWMRSICRCRLRQINLLQREEYLIVPLSSRIPADRGPNSVDNNAESQALGNGHADPNGSATPTATCWCGSGHRPYGDRHLPYLGLLLAEIAIGNRIMVAGTANFGPLLRINGGDISVDNLTRRVRRDTGSDSFANAVHHCLVSNVAPEGVVDNDLNQFYNAVFMPLKKTYQGLLADPVRRERHLQAMAN